MSALLPATGTVARELASGALVAVAFVMLLAAAEVWQRLARPPVEWTRKLVHIAGGVVSGAFPWLFSTHWTVLLLGLASFGILAAGKRLGLLGSVTGVERRSVGELYFPVSVYLLFVVARHQPVFYLIALSALVFSDSAAALVGSAYGRHAYTVAADRRTLEGSAAFMFATFLGVHLALLLATDIDRLASVLVAVQIALLVTSFEAISMRGNDNLIVPLATYYLLLKLTPQPPQAIAAQLVVQLGILLGMLLLARRTGFLTLAGAVAAHLSLYAAFSLGGPEWSIAPLLALAGILAFQEVGASPASAEGPHHQVREVFYVSVVSVALLFLDNSFATLVRGHPLSTGHPFFIAFVGSFAATLAIVGFRALRHSRIRWGPSPGAASAALSTAAIAISMAWIAVVPLSLWAGAGGLAIMPVMVTAIMCVGSMALYLAGSMILKPRPASVWDLRLQALCVAVAAAASFALTWAATGRA